MKTAVRRVLWALAIIIGIIVILVAPFLLLTPRAPKPPAEVDSPETLEAYLNALVANQTPPAIDITVMRDGAIVYSKAFGVADGPSRRPATTDQVYHFWSVTKLFTATAVMQLVEDGKIGLDDPVTRFLPDFKATSPAGAPADITIRQLLDHSAGMKDLAPGDLLGWIHHLDEAAVSETAIVRDRMAGYRRLASDPGKTAAYSNAGYIVLGAVIETVSGRSLEDFIRQRILTPLGMSKTDFVYRDDMLASAVSGSHPLFHAFTPLLLVIHRDWFSAWVDKTERQRMWLKPLYIDYKAPTGLIGTGEDLAKFGEAYLEGGALGGQRILKPETVAAMLSDNYGANTGPDGDRMGLGWHWWNKAPIEFRGHGGDGPGFGAQLAIFPKEKMVVAVLANDTLIDRVAITNLVAAAFK